MDRLTEWRGERWVAVQEPTNGKTIGDKAVYTKLAEYENAEEQGLLIHRPCKIGDRLYVIAYCEDIYMYYDNETGTAECPFEETCDLEECDDEGLRILEAVVACFSEDKYDRLIYFEKLSGWRRFSDFGKTIFFSRDEAEAEFNNLK